MKFALIPAGSFTMGSQLSPEEIDSRYGDSIATWPQVLKYEQPPHAVKITKPFYLQTTEFSQAQWKKLWGIIHQNLKTAEMTVPLIVFPGMKPKNLSTSLIRWRELTNIVFRLRLSGNMHAGQEPRRHFPQENAFRPIWLTMMGTIQEIIVPKGKIEIRPLKLGVSNPMPGAYTTCTATSGNGAKNILATTAPIQPEFRLIYTSSRRYAADDG